MDMFLAGFGARILDPMIIAIALVVSFLGWCGLTGATMKDEAHFAPLAGATLAAVAGEAQLFLALGEHYRFLPWVSWGCGAAALVWAAAGAVAAVWFMKQTH